MLKHPWDCKESDITQQLQCNDVTNQYISLHHMLLLLLSRFSHVRPVRPHRWQLTRLPRPWDSPGKNTGVGCHFLLQCMKVKSEREVAQSCPTLRDSIDCSPPGSSIRGIFQARVLAWVPLPSPTTQYRVSQKNACFGKF